MKELFLTMCLMFFTSCTHHHEKPKHHHHAYEQTCAHGVLNNDFKLKGKKEFSLKHAGTTYYFHSLKRKQAFEQNLRENIRQANDNWDRRAR